MTVFREEVLYPDTFLIEPFRPDKTLFFPVFSVNYSFPSTTTISPYERHLPPLAADDIVIELG